MATAHRTTGGGQSKSDEVLTAEQVSEEFLAPRCPPTALTRAELQEKLNLTRDRVFRLMNRARAQGRLVTYERAKPIPDVAGAVQWRPAYEFLKEKK